MPNISRSKGNQTIKLDQLIECNMRHICLEKLYAKCDWETSPRTFSENFNLSISLDQKSKVLCSLYLLHAKLRAIKTFWNLADHFLLPHITLFYKIKRGLSLGSLPHFQHNVWRKIFLLLYSINWPSFTLRLALLREILGNMCIAIVC